MVYGCMIVGFIAAGFAGLKTYFDQGGRAESLEDRGVAADANVVSVRRGEPTTLTVSYDPPGEQFLEFAEVVDCSEARYEAGLEVVRVVYLPDDPDVIRMEACTSSFDSDFLPGIFGVVFLAFAIFALWRLRRLWTS